MNVIHVTPSYPPELGGMENTVKELAERTARKKYTVKVVTSRFKEFKKSKTTDNLTECRLPSIRIYGIPVTIPCLPFRLFRLIEKDSIVHVHYILNFSMDIAVIVAKLKKAKVIAHMHIDPLPSGPYGRFNPLYKKLVWKKVLPLADLVICPTEDYIENVTQKYNVLKNKCAVLPSGIDIMRFPVKPSLDISSPAKILFVGRLSRQKNVPRLLDAFRLLQKKHDSVLHIAGDGEERSSIESYIKTNDIPNVVLHGTVVGERLPALYASCDIFVLPSDYESFGIVNLEAMAAGIPIVASDIPGVRRLLQDSAILVSADAQKFADAMAWLIEDKEKRYELVSKGLQKVKNYDWDSITDKLLDIYKSLSPAS